MKSKRIIPVLILLIIIVYLAIYLVKDIPNNNGVSYSNTTNVKANENKNTTKEVWKDNNPIKVGLYYNDKTAGKRVLKNTHTANFEYHKDIISFNAFFTDEKEISNGNLINIYESYVNKYNEDISSYRIGYIVEFNNNSYQIIRPKDTESFYDTLEVYLYDAIAHKNDSWRFDIP